MFDAALQIGGISLSYLESGLLGLFILAWVVHVFYALRYFLPSTKVKTFNQEEQQGVSVIVCARNEEENLRELIPAIMEQEYAEFQLIIVNDSSWDET
ncbi:MAG: glycosyltransferase, partial [Bacteroidota bacterium]